MKNGLVLVEIVLCPSVVALVRCGKADLLLVADFSNIPVARTARKADIRECVLVPLREDRRSPVSPDSGSPAVAQAAILHGLDSASVAVGDGGVLSTAEAAGQSPGTSPGIDLVTSPLGAGPLSDLDLNMAIKLKELDLAIKQQERETQLLRLRALELEASRSASSRQLVSHSSEFDVSKYISLVPPFRESEVDSYFTAFERVAAITH